MTAFLIDHINEKCGVTPSNIYQAEFPLELLHSMNMVPCGYHRYYYMKQAMLEHAIEEFNEGGTRAEQMKQVEHELFEIYKNAELHEKPEQLGKRGGAYYSDAACECIRAIYANKKIHMVVSTQNNGAISCLDDDSIVEVSSIISATGAQPMAFGKLPSAEKGWLQMMKAMEECTIEAALTGDYGKALEAFVLNPLVENNEAQNEGTDYFIRKYINQLLQKDSQIDTVILGCTHYPLLLPKIQQYIPDNIRVIAQGEYVAESLKDYLCRHPEMDIKCTKNNSCLFYTTEAEDKFIESASTFLNQQINVKRITLE